MIYWAKTDNGKPDGTPTVCVRDRCLDTGCVAEALVPNIPGAATLAALHDVGRISPGFELQSDVWSAQYGPVTESSSETDHAVISQYTACNVTITDDWGFCNAALVRVALAE